MPDEHLHITCPSCGKQLKVSAKFAGRRGRCPSCSKPIDIPKPELNEVEDATADWLDDGDDQPPDDSPSAPLGPNPSHPLGINVNGKHSGTEQPLPEPPPIATPFDTAPFNSVQGEQGEPLDTAQSKPPPKPKTKFVIPGINLFSIANLLTHSPDARHTFSKSLPYIIHYGPPILLFLIFPIIEPITLLALLVPAALWYFIIGRLVAKFLPQQLLAGLISTVACPRCSELHDLTTEWSCGCGYKDHRQINAYAFTCPNCGNRIGHFDCPRCDATILL